MDERQEGLGEFVVARGDASELLDAVEETVDQIAVLVDMPIERTRIDSVGARRNDGLAALCRDDFDEGIRVVALVGHDKVGRLIFDQSGSVRDIGDLACRENDASGLPRESTVTCSLVVNPPRERPIS